MKSKAVVCVCVCARARARTHTNFGLAFKVYKKDEMVDPILQAAINTLGNRFSLTHRHSGDTGIILTRNQSTARILWHILMLVLAEAPPQTVLVLQNSFRLESYAFE